jgi:hypothetical protein
MFSLFCIIVKNNNMFPVITTVNPRKKGTDVRASEFDFSIVISFPVIAISKRQKK